MKRSGVQFALTNPMSPETDEEYNRWCAEHVPYSLLLPGRTSARRYRWADESNQLAPKLTTAATHRYLTVYELDDVSAVADARSLRPWLAEVAKAPTTSALDTDGMMVSVYELISENTTKPALPPGVVAPTTDGAPDGPRAVVIVFSQPRSEADDAEYNRWYDEVHTGESLLLPGYVRSRRFRLAPPDDQAVPERVASWDYRYLTIYDIQNVHCVPLARQAMSWLKEISIEFASPALHPGGPMCWTFEQIFETYERATLPDGIVVPVGENRVSP